MNTPRGFDGVIGHEEVIGHLQNAIRLNKISHAYIFGGEQGSGKKMLANLFAMTLQCAEHGIEPCLSCPSCKKAQSRNHPDIIRITHEKPDSIGVDDVRTQLVNDVDIKPYESRFKIYIIEDAEKLTPQAQNAILKTIEEPPAYAVIMLLADNPEKLLPTITSRAMTLNLKPVGNQLVKEYLVDQLHVPEEQAEIDASFARGNIGRARKAAESEDFQEMTMNALRLLRRSRTMELFEIVDAIKSMTAMKNNIYDYLDLFRMWFRDVLLFKATKDVDGLIFREELNAIRERAARSSYEGIERILDSIQTAELRLRANVNFELVMELLFLTIREN